MWAHEGVSTIKEIETTNRYNHTGKMERMIIWLVTHSAVTWVWTEHDELHVPSWHSVKIPHFYLSMTGPLKGQAELHFTQNFPIIFLPPSYASESRGCHRILLLGCHFLVVSLYLDVWTNFLSYNISRSPWKLELKVAVWARETTPCQNVVA